MNEPTMTDFSKRSSHLGGQDGSNEDAVEAIFALNMGDFVTEHLISDDLLSKITATLNTHPEKLKHQLQELIEIYSLNNTLSLLGFGADQSVVLYDSIAASIAEMLQMDACHLFQTTYQDGKANFLALTGTSIPHYTRLGSPVGYNLSQTDLLVVEAYEEGYPMAVSDVTSDLSGWTPLKSLNQDAVESFIAVPMREGARHVGLILFESYSSLDFTPEMIDLADATTNVFMVSLHLQRLLEQAQKLVTQDNPNVNEMRSVRAQLTELIADLGRNQQFFVESLAYAIDARNQFTQGHAQGVARIARDVAQQMDLSEKTVDLVYYAGLLQGLGKIHIPQEILTKEEALTPKELELLKNSPNVGVGMLMKMNFMAEVIPYVDYHKERWDGIDSPHGLSGRSIPLGARIIAVADAYHALTNPRPYREKPLSHKDALDLLQSEAGSKWDPDVVNSLVAIIADSAV